MRHQGKGRQHQHGKQIGRKGKDFLQPCLLLLLVKQDQHGYELLQGLSQFVSNIESYDPSIIYRLLRGMEVENLVQSYEGEVSRGPRRRIYSLTDSGKKQLHGWAEQLHDKRNEIDIFLDQFNKSCG